MKKTILILLVLLFNSQINSAEQATNKNYYKKAQQFTEAVAKKDNISKWPECVQLLIKKFYFNIGLIAQLLHDKDIEQAIIFFKRYIIYLNEVSQLIDNIIQVISQKKESSGLGDIKQLVTCIEKEFWPKTQRIINDDVKDLRGIIQNKNDESSASFIKACEECEEKVKDIRGKIRQIKRLLIDYAEDVDKMIIQNKQEIRDTLVQYREELKQNNKNKTNVAKNTAAAVQQAKPKVVDIDKAFPKEKQKKPEVKSDTKKKKKKRKDKKSKAPQQQKELEHQAQQAAKDVEVERKVALEDKSKVFSELYEAIRNYELNKVARLIKLIQQNNLNINELHEGTTALHVASEWGFVDAVEALMDAGAEASIYDNQGYTALHFAASNGFIELPNPKDNWDLESYLDFYLESRDHRRYKKIKINSFEDFTKILRIMIEKRWNKDNKIFDLRTKNKKRNILHLACKYDNPSTVLLCLELCSPTSPDGHNLLPIHLAAMTQNPEVLIMMLKKSQSQVDAKNGLDSTPLHLACIDDTYIDNVKILVENRANIEAKNAKGFTAAQIAGIFGSDKIIRYLQAAGADLNSKSGMKQSATEYFNAVVRTITDLKLNPAEIDDYLAKIRQDNLHLVLE